MRIGSVIWALLLASPLAAQQITFTYENPKLQPPKYVITIHEDGAGHFQSEPGGPPSADPSNMPADPLDVPIHLSRALRDSMFATARKSKLFAMNCADGSKNIAFQGTKTLAYEGPDGQGSCTFNWSKSAQVDKLVDQFQSVALTLEEGSKLQRQYEHSRLSLDSEMEFLAQMVHEGRAVEVQNIAPILQKLAGDEAILQRVQRRARELLAAAKND